MSVEIIDVKMEHCPAARLIGKMYAGRPNWGEWWANDWFAVLEKQPSIAFNGDAYLGAVRIVNGAPQRWIGMLFAENAPVPDGFESVDIPPMDYAVFYLRDQEHSGDFYTMETHNRCLETLKAQGLARKEDDWCFERYNCPRFTAADENGCVILDYAIAIEG